MKDSFTLEEILLNPNQFSNDTWLFLPREEKWFLRTRGVFLQLPEVTPEEEEEFGEIMPSYATKNNLLLVLHAAAIKGIVENVRMQRSAANTESLFSAFIYYVDHDAFLQFE